MKQPSSTASGSNRRHHELGAGLRAACTGAIAVAAVGLLSVGAAKADTFVPLPDGEQTGPGVKITRTGETAVIAPSMADNGAGRITYVSGTIIAEVPDVNPAPAGPYTAPKNNPGTNNSSTHGASQLNTGYIVGCQVSIGTSAISAGLGATVSASGGSISGAASINLGPGQVAFVQTAMKDISAPGGTVSIIYKDFKINVEGCAGFAQARAYTNLEIVGTDYSRTTLYGQPFSIG